MKTYSQNDVLFDESGQAWVPEGVARSLYAALRRIKDGPFPQDLDCAEDHLRFDEQIAAAALAAADGEDG
jgi:uncharacterized phage-associated protein